MRVGLVLMKDTPRGQYILECFEAGVRQHGDDPVWVRGKKDLSTLAGVDVAAGVCYPNKHHGGTPEGIFRLQVAELLKRHGRRLIAIDTGFVRSQPHLELQALTSDTKVFDVSRPETYARYDGRIYYSVGYDGIKRCADYCNTGSLPDRWRKLGVELQPWRRRGESVVLIGQTLYGLSSQHQNIYHWYRDVVQAIRRHTRRPIIFRTHPRLSHLRTTKDRFKADIERVLKNVGRVTDFTVSKQTLLDRDLRHAWAVVSFTSNAAVEAAITGVPVFALDHGNMAWEVANRRLDRLDSPKYPAREQWAYNLAYAQWNCDELTGGEAWARLRPFALERRKS